MATAKGKSVKVKDLTLKLPAKLPFVTVRYVYVSENNVDVAPLLEAILGPEQAEKVWALGLDVDEGAALVDEIIGKYGVDTGK